MQITLNITLELPADLAEILGASVQSHPDAFDEVPSCPWQSEGVPAGFQTVVGRMAERGLLDGGSLIVPTAEATIRDGFWCKARSSMSIKVPAPQKLRDMGIREINAYPVGVVDDRINLILARLEVEENPQSRAAKRMLADVEDFLTSKYRR